MAEDAQTARIKDISELLEDVIEQLADIEHTRWAHWQRYMHSKCECQPDGSLVIPPNLVQQWERQIEAPYCALTDKEKESDREQVRKYLPIIVDALKERGEGIQTARISELEARLTKAEELLTAHVGLVDWLCETGEARSWWLDDNDKATIKEARDFIAAKKGE